MNKKYIISPLKLGNVKVGYLTEEQAAEYLNCCTKTLFNYRKTKELKFYTLGKNSVRYKLQDLDHFMESKGA